MANGRAAQLGRQLARGGEQLPVEKDPDRFTVRLSRGAAPDRLERALPAEHVRSLDRPRLEEFAAEPERLDEAMDEARASDDAAFASHVYRVEDDPETPLYLTDELTVQFAPDVEDAEVERLTAELGLELVRSVEGVERAYVFRVTGQAQENPIKVANRLLEHDQVLASEPNVAVPTHSDYVPADTRFPTQWHLDHSGGPFLAAGSHVDAKRAWDVTRGERSVVVAVTDDSADLRHVDFTGQGKVVAPRDFHDRDFTPEPGLPDDNHGTACAGVAVAEENGQGVVGAAPGCALMPVRTSATIDDNSIEELFAWVRERGAAVVSNSWSAAARNFPLSIRQRAAVHRAATEGRGGLGCVIVFAAGNSNRPLNGTVDERGWPGNRPSGPTRWLDGLASHPDVIAVAACTSMGRKSAYSNWGREISVCAPSNNAPPDTYPAVTSPTPGRGIVTTDRVGSLGYSSADYTSTFGGTSSACPLVAGVAALVLSANPGLRATEVREILESTADKVEDPDRDPQLGQSLGTYDSSGHSQWFGHGKVNAFRAVTAAVAAREAEGERTYRAESAPGAQIPDDRPAGVADRVTFADEAIVDRVAVTVDIEHSYVGDLRLTLVSPSGRTVVLHDRRGGRQRNLQRTFEPESTPALSTLAGEQLRGSWTLRVEDLAPRDVGRLVRWALEVRGRPAAVVELADAAGTQIPDNDPAGIERTLVAPGNGTVRDLELSLSIVHPYVGDLHAELVAPSGRAVVLHDRTGGSQDNLIRSYSTATDPLLAPVRGEGIQGAWKLKVADLEGRDLGKLDRWGLRITPAG